MRTLPEAALVCDHFHFINLYNDKLSDLRGKLYFTMKPPTCFRNR